VWLVTARKHPSCPPGGVENVLDFVFVTDEIQPMANSQIKLSQHQNEKSLVLRNS